MDTPGSYLYKIMVDFSCDAFLFASRILFMHAIQLMSKGCTLHNRMLVPEVNAKMDKQ